MEVVRAGRHPAVSLEESALIDALRRGDEEAFARLVGELHDGLRRFARLYVKDVAVAEEVVQDTWLVVIRGLWAFEGRSSLKTWIYRILVNRARTRAAREGRRAPLEGGPGTEEGADGDPSVGPERFLPAGHPSGPGGWARPPLDPGSSPERALLTKELGEKLRSVIDALPGNLRTVLWLHDVEGWSSEEVRNALAIRETNMRVLLHRARSRVRLALEPYLEAARGETRHA